MGGRIPGAWDVCCVAAGHEYATPKGVDHGLHPPHNSPHSHLKAPSHHTHTHTLQVADVASRWGEARHAEVDHVLGLLQRRKAAEQAVAGLEAAARAQVGRVQV